MNKKFINALLKNIATTIKNTIDEQLTYDAEIIDEKVKRSKNRKKHKKTYKRRNRNSIYGNMYYPAMRYGMWGGMPMMPIGGGHHALPGPGPADFGGFDSGDFGGCDGGCDGGM